MRSRKGRPYRRPEVLGCLDNGQQFAPGHAVVSLCVAQGLTKIGDDSLLALLNLGEDGSHASALASVSRMYDSFGSGYPSTGASVRLFFRASNASWCPEVQSHGVFLLVRVDRELAIVAKSGMNCR